jgi:type IV pilus assembly protein PilB
VTKKKNKRKIGQILLDEGLVAPEQIKTASILQKTNKKKLGKILIELDYLTEKQLIDAISSQFSFPVVDWKNVSVSPKLISLVPREVAEKRLIFPLELKQQSLLLAMADPLDLGTIDYITFRNGLNVRVAVSTEEGIRKAIERHYGSSNLLDNVLQDIPDYDVEFVKESSDDLKESAESLMKLSEAAPVVKLVTTILVDAVRSRASDVHIEPAEKSVRVRYRVDGKLRDILTYPKNIHAAVVSRVKIIARLDISKRMCPQDGRSALRLEDRDVDLRVSTIPSVRGEKVVVRLLDQATGLVNIDKLGMPPRTFERVIRLIGNPQGMVLVSGPTGSGKSTTLYSMLQQLRSETENIVTIEDPVEYQLSGITQIQVNEVQGLTFPSALRSILRQDPDIIMLGEIRDRETAEIALRAAVTGHLVLSTIHTNDTVSTVTRLMDIGIPHYLINAALVGVLAQRLVRRICPHCSTQDDPTQQIVDTCYPPLETSFRGGGCERCNHSGYSGRMGVYELLEINSDFRESVAKFTTEDRLWDVARQNGTTTLFDYAWNKVNEGMTTVDEVLSKIHYKSFAEAANKPKGRLLALHKESDQARPQV